MPTTHDPYLDTVRRSLNEVKIKSRKDKIDAEEKFLSKKIILSDYIYLPEELEKFFILTIFILIPYILGAITILLFKGFQELKVLLVFKFDLFMLLWTIGYEVLTFLLLSLIIKSAFSFKKS